MSEHPYMEGKTLHEKQSQFFNAHRCPYCGEQTQLIDSIKVYRESYGLIFFCEKDAAWVGVHKGTDQSLGTLAKKGLRELRHQCHLVFDPLWQTKKEATGLSTKAVRGKAYKWVSEILGIEREAAHIGYLNSEQCKKLIDECRKFYPSPEQAARKKQELEDNIKLIEFLAGYFDYKVTEFSLNGRHDFTLSKEGKKKMFIKLTERVVGFESKKTINYNPIKNLEKLLTNHFK